MVSMVADEKSQPQLLSKKAACNSHGQDSSYFLGWEEYEKNPYDPVSNLGGIIQMGLAENQLSFDLLESWLEANPDALGLRRGGASVFRELALFQDYHGMPAFKNALARFISEQRGYRVAFDPSNIVLTAGATSANEALMFCLADHGNAFLIPTPYYPGYVYTWRCCLRFYSRNVQVQVAAAARHAPAPAPAAAGGDPDDSGDGSDGEDEDEDEDGDDDGDSNNEDDNNNDAPDNNNDAGGNQGEDPQKMETTYEVITSVDEHGYFSALLEDVLHELGSTVRPLYITQRISDPLLGDYYYTRVHIRERRMASEEEFDDGEFFDDFEEF